MCNKQRLRPACAYGQSDQSLCLSIEYSMTVKLVTKQYLEFLSLKGGCKGLSESTLVKMAHYWRSHVAAQIKIVFICIHLFKQCFCFLIYYHNFIPSACPLEVRVPSLTGPVSCTLSSKCSGISCCMESARINRVFRYILNIDPCSMKLTFGIEKMLFDLPLLDYVWGRYS